LCCIAFLGMVARSLRLITAHRSAFETLNVFISVYSAGNVGILALLLKGTENSSVSASMLESSQLICCDFSGSLLSIEIRSLGLISTRNVSIAKFRGLKIMYKDVFGNLNWQETRSITSKHSMDTLANTKLSGKLSRKGSYFNNPQYRPCYSRWLRKILLFYKKC
jgi:hypothetical protein